MAITSPEQWSVTPALNVDINSIPLGENLTFPAHVNNLFREMMAQLAGYLTSVDAGASAGPALILYRNSATPAASDFIGKLQFNGEDSAGNTEEYANIGAGIQDPTSTSEDGFLRFRTKVAGSITDRVTIDSTSISIGTPSVSVNQSSTAFYPSPSNTLSLGGLGQHWSDLYLGDGSVIAWNDTDLTLTHSTDDLTLSGGTFTLPNTGLHLLDTNASHDLIIAPGSNLTADRTLTVTTGDANHTLDISGAPTTITMAEGTWTPTLTTDGTDFSSVTYDAVTTGKYSRYGNVVFISGRLRTDAVTVGAATGNVQIGGLPFTAAASPDSVLTVWAQAWAGEEPAKMVTNGTTTKAYLYYRATVDGNDTTTVVADVGTGANANDINFSGFYFV